MIEYIQGKVDDLQPAQAVLEAGGVGYLLSISLNTYTALQGKDNARLYAYEAIREDAHLLYGFATRQERDLFLLLISVSGVGTNTARMILSSYPVAELEAAIASGNSAALKSVKGVGAKTAQRIIVDLKDKINTVDASLLSISPLNNEAFDEALAALVMLGYSRQATHKTLQKLFQSDPTLTVEKAIKSALKML